MIKYTYRIAKPSLDTSLALITNGYQPFVPILWEIDTGDHIYSGSKGDDVDQVMKILGLPEKTLEEESMKIWYLHYNKWIVNDTFTFRL